MYKKVLALILMCITLAGCSQSKITGPDAITDNGAYSSEYDKEEENKITNTPSLDYAHDNLGNQDIGQYNSGIYSNEVNLSKPYSYKGEVLSGESTIQIEDSEQLEYENAKEPVQNNDESRMPDNIKSELTSLYDELALYIDKDTGEYIINQGYNEDRDSAIVRVAIESNRIKERIKEIEDEFGKLQTSDNITDKLNNGADIDSTLINTSDIQSIIIDGVYYNGIFIINAIESIDEFNESHKISANGVLKLVKSNLESIEYCDNIIQSTNDKKLISSWKVLKQDLINWRSNLSKISTIEDYQLSNIVMSDKEKEHLSKFLDNFNRLG